MRRAAVLGAFLGLLATSCSGGSPEAKLALLDAADQTKSAESFHIESVFTAPDGTHEGEADYVAPDRFRMRGFGEGAATTIYIGRDGYGTFPENLSRFFHYEEPCDLGIEGFFPALEVVSLAEDVDRIGGTYRFSVPGEGNQGEARIEDGYIVYLVLRYDLTMMGEVEERHSLDGFNSGIRIEPPPARQVEEEGSQNGGVISVDEGSAPDCSSVGGPPA